MSMQADQTHPVHINNLRTFGNLCKPEWKTDNFCIDVKSYLFKDTCWHKAWGPFPFDAIYVFEYTQADFSPED